MENRREGRIEEWNASIGKADGIVIEVMLQYFNSSILQFSKRGPRNLAKSLAQRNIISTFAQVCKSNECVRTDVAVGKVESGKFNSPKNERK